MRVTITILAVALLATPIVSASNSDEYCVNGIYTALTSVIFNGSTAAQYVPASCQNPLKVGTIYASASKYCTDHEIEAGISWLSKTCLKYGLELLPYGDFQKNLTQNYLSRLRVIEYGETITETVATTVLISRPYYDLGYRTIVSTHNLAWQAFNTDSSRPLMIIKNGRIIHMGRSSITHFSFLGTNVYTDSPCMDSGAGSS